MMTQVSEVSHLVCKLCSLQQNDDTENCKDIFTNSVRHNNIEKYLCSKISLLDICFGTFSDLSVLIYDIKLPKCYTFPNLCSKFVKSK